VRERKAEPSRGENRLLIVHLMMDLDRLSGHGPEGHRFGLVGEFGARWMSQRLSSRLSGGRYPNKAPLWG
jgi:hypothetical protein